jgi:hypothetical protein
MSIRARNPISATCGEMSIAVSAPLLKAPYVLVPDLGHHLSSSDFPTNLIRRKRHFCISCGAKRSNCTSSIRAGFGSAAGVSAASANVSSGPPDDIGRGQNRYAAPRSAQAFRAARNDRSQMDWRRTCLPGLKRNRITCACCKKSETIFKSLKRVPFTAIQQEVAHRRNAQVDPAMKVIRAQSVTKKNARGKTL